MENNLQLFRRIVNYKILIVVFLVARIRCSGTVAAAAWSGTRLSEPRDSLYRGRYFIYY